MLAMRIGVSNSSAPDGYQPFPSFSEWADRITSSGLYNDYVAAWKATRDSATADDNARALDFVMRSAAIETGAIEGLYTTPRGVTLTVAMQGAAWQASLHEIGPDVQGHFEAQLDAFESILDVATGAVPLTERWIRDLHAVSCRNQHTYRVLTDHGWQDRPLHHGDYKDEPNHVVQPDGVTHFYCPVLDVAPELERLISETRTTQFAASPPVVQTAYFHHALASVHPFSDGNGRVCRAASSVFLYRDAGIPLVIFSDQAGTYRAALGEADAVNTQPFVQFIEDRALDTLGLARQQLDSIRAGRPEDRLRRLFLAHGGRTHAEVEMIGRRVLHAVDEATSQLLDERLPEGVVRTKTDMAQTCTFGRPYHSPPDRNGFSIHLGCVDPASAGAECTPMLGIADDVAERYVFTVIDANRPDRPPLQARLDEVDPMSEAGRLNIDSWAQSLIDRLIEDFAYGVEQGLTAWRYKSRSTPAGGV